MSGSESRSEAIADAIRSAIVTGRLKPGERIVEDVVAEEHDVSRVPVREALRRLEAEGFITLTPHRGATVVAPSRREGLELLAVRRGLEVLAARLASERRGEGYERQLLETVEQETEASHRHDVEAGLRLSLHFHEVVRLASGNEQLRVMLSRLVERISWVFELDVDQRSAGAAADHSAITHAILHGASIQAAYLMDEHVAQDEELYRARTPLGS
jgi:DNA-binding GntR family transcriptional regulator